MGVRASAPPRTRRRHDQARAFETQPVVVCSVDDPRADTAVVALAADLVERLDGRLALVHVQPPPLITLEPQVAYVAAQPDPARELRDTGRDLACLAADAGVAPGTNLYVAFGDREERLLAEARHQSASLIIVGRRAGSTSRRRLPARVIEGANCPVLVADQDTALRRTDWGKRPMAFGSTRGDAVAMASIEGEREMTTSIICGVDGSEHGRLALRFAAQLASTLRVRLVVVHVVQPPVPAPGLGPTAGQLATVPLEALVAGGEALVDQVLGEEKISAATRRVVLGFPADRLADLADEEAAELVVVGSRGRGPFKAAFLGSVSTDLIAVARCPVLVVPPAAAGTIGEAGQIRARSLTQAL